MMGSSPGSPAASSRREAAPSRMRPPASTECQERALAGSGDLAVMLRRSKYRPRRTASCSALAATCSTASSAPRSSFATLHKHCKASRNTLVGPQTSAARSAVALSLSRRWALWSAVRAACKASPVFRSSSHWCSCAGLSQIAPSSAAAAAWSCNNDPSSVRGDALPVSSTAPRARRPGGRKTRVASAGVLARSTRPQGSRSRAAPRRSRSK
mmetsp:Transcript_85547/g.228851  ORF Transcript_85547/g.228851 Transcript_85547/m.228851 type:complete len:212 (-) Transcript_85547:88-723(-)